MNIAKMRRHVAGAAERRKAEEERLRAYFESGVMTKEHARIIMLPPLPRPQFHPFRDRLPRVTAASYPTAWTTPARRGL